MKRARWMAPVATILVACGVVDRADARPAAVRRPAWGALPVVDRIPAPPTRDAAPKRVEPTERVEGLRVEREDDRHRVRARVFADGPPDGAPSPCMAGDVDLSTEADPTAQQPNGVVFLRLGVVTAVRSERVLPAADGSASLEISDVWVDPTTQGARLATRTIVPMVRVADGPSALAVYAFRTGSSASIVVPTSAGARARDAEGKVAFGSCSHMRVSIGSAEAGGSALVSSRSSVRWSADEPLKAGWIDVSASVSKLSRDPAPVVSVVVSWVPDPETHMPRPMTR